MPPSVVPEAESTVPAAANRERQAAFVRDVDDCGDLGGVDRPGNDGRMAIDTAREDLACLVVVGIGRR